MSTETAIPNRKAENAISPHLLVLAGAIAPILFGAIFTLDGTLKSGYSAFNEAISYIEVGANGCIQQANFIIFGLLLIAFAIGYVQTLRSVLPRRWLYPITTLLILSDFGWIMAGLFIPDPYLAPQTSWHAVLHQVASITVFLPFAIACLIQAAKFLRTRGWRIYGGYCLVLGILQAVFPIGTIVYLINPTTFGNVNSPNDGVINRIVLLIGPFAWYFITAAILSRHASQER